ncbi:MAG TPA: hypothetical protein VGJ21_23190 [Terracidiphilus sp.]
MIDCIAVNGTRRERTVPQRPGVTGNPVEMVEETWYSTELQLVDFQKQRDSSGHVMTISLSHFDRGEPDAALFKVPHGYHVAGAPGRRRRMVDCAAGC